MRKKLIVCLMSAVWPFAACEGYDLAGTWHVSGLNLPGAITQSSNAQGVLVGLNGNSTFDISEGFLTISPTGEVSGTVEDSVSGTATVSADGVVSLALTLPEVMTLTLPITTNSDLMATAHGASDYHELLLMAKAPASAAAADVVGTWWVVDLQTPASIGLQRDPQGRVIQVNGTNDFNQSRATLVIDQAGNYNYNSGEQLGSVSVGANGAVSLTPGSPQEPLLEFNLNTGKDVMIDSHRDAYGSELTILVKQHTVNAWEAAGSWALGTLNLPGSLIVHTNGSGQVINIDGLDSFMHRNGGITFSLDGSLTGHLEGSFAGNTASTTDGTLPIYHGEPVPFIGAINAGGDFFVGVDSDGGSLEMLVGVRSVRPLISAMLPGSPLKVVWVAGAGRALQEADASFQWHTVTGSETMTSYAPDPSTEGARHFYRLMEQP
ncbi:MAG: hypothetical protein ABI600_08305 [Luteolibacter sp.]